MTEQIKRRLFMIRALYMKIAVVVMLLLMYDDVIDFLEHGANFILDGIEYSIELAVAFVFATNQHDSEIIAANFLFFLAFCVLFIIARMLPGLLRKLQRNLQSRWDRFKLRIAQNWMTLSLLQKIKALATSTLVFSCFAIWVLI